MKEYCDLENVN